MGGGGSVRECIRVWEFVSVWESVSESVWERRSYSIRVSFYDCWAANLFWTPRQSTNCLPDIKLYNGKCSSQRKPQISHRMKKYFTRYLKQKEGYMLKYATYSQRDTRGYTARRTVLLGKQSISLEEIPAFYRTRSFITALAKARHWTLS
jgi:hypothetical protein